MTIICAMHEEGVGTWIASDTMISARGALMGYRRKWVTKNGLSVAAAGSTAALDLIAEHSGEFNPEWTATGFFRWLRPLLDDYGFKAEHETGGPPWYDCSCLLATPRGVLSVDSGGGGTPLGIGGFYSRGSGADQADGAAWALARLGKSPSNIVGEAVLAAIAHANGCGGELWIDCLRMPS